MRVSVLPCAWGKPGELAASFLKAGIGCQGIWKGYSVIACKLLWDHLAEQLWENSELGFGVSQCRHILRLLLHWWWQCWLLISVSFLSGVCLGAGFFHLFAKPPSASIPNHLGLKSVWFCMRNKCPYINRELFFGKTTLNLGHAFISSGLQTESLQWCKGLFVLFFLTTAVIENILICSLPSSSLGWWLGTATCDLLVLRYLLSMGEQGLW